MDRTIYRIEMLALSRGIEHLQTLDLAGMETLAATHGTRREQELIAAVRAFLQTLP